MNRAIILMAGLCIALSSCGNRPENNQEDFTADDRSMAEMAEVKEIIYSMYLPTDLSDILDKTGANFDPKLPAPVTDLQLYDDEEQIAIMLGVYGVDLSYMKILEQTLLAADYFSAIQRLSEKIGIPDSIFIAANNQLEENLNNQDSLTSVIHNIYMETDAYFRENGKEDLMALSLLGGWVEAMYIGANIYQSGMGNTSMADKLLQQKFSLNSIISVLSEHQESLHVSTCLLLLKKLKKEYEQVQVLYEKDGFSVDTTEKKIMSSQAHIRYDKATLDQITKMIRQIRWELIKTQV